MDTEEIYGRIEKYLDGALSIEEKKTFEHEMKNNHSLKEEVDLHRQVAETLKGEKIHEFRDVLKKVDSKWSSSPSEKNNVFPLRFKRMAALAATILLLVIAIYPFVFQGADISNEDLFANNFEPYKMILNQRSISDNDAETALLNEAIIAYDNKNYKAASSAFQALQNNNRDLIALRFYTGLSELGEGNSDAAINIFNEILDTPDHLFLEQSNWYLALAYLQKRNSDAASSALNKIQEGQFKYKEAVKMIELME